MGYKNVSTGGYSFFSCGNGDTFATKFNAIDQTGKAVSGTVCSGLLKGNTVRLD